MSKVHEAKSSALETSVSASRPDHAETGVMDLRGTSVLDLNSFSGIISWDDCSESDYAVPAPILVNLSSALVTLVRLGGVAMDVVHKSSNPEPGCAGAAPLFGSSLFREREENSIAPEVDDPEPDHAVPAPLPRRSLPEVPILNLHCAKSPLFSWPLYGWISMELPRSLQSQSKL